MRLYQSTYKNIDCVIVENESLKIKILPSQGAKIVSLVDINTGYEALIQNPNRLYNCSQYGDSFTGGEMSGIDDMLPSVSECIYANSEYVGVHVPDHGEVWALSWDCEVGQNSIKLTADGVAFPYVFTKTITLRKNTLHIKYAVINKGDKSLDFVWALHPLFKAVEGMQIIFPDTVSEVINVYNNNRVMGKFGTKYMWPNIIDVTGEKRHLSIVPKEDGTCMKFYMLGKHAGWCALRNPKDNLIIELSYPQQTVDYLGVWTDYMGYAPKPLYNVALEPCIGGYDSLEYAQKAGTCKTLSANEKLDWYVDITLRKIEQRGRYEK